MSKTFHEEAGKGDFRRPSEVSKEQYDSNWDRIFGKDKKPTVELCRRCHNERCVHEYGELVECPACLKD